MALKGKGDDTGSNRRERAKGTLERCAAHTIGSLDHASALVGDGTELATKLLEGRTAPEAIISDIAALSINALSAFCRCFHHGDDDVPGTVQRVVPDAQETIDLVFDIRSETAGPLVLNAASPLTWIDTTNLVGPPGTIPSQRVLVRTFGTGIMISLCDLRGVKSGVYEGTVIFTDTGGTAMSFNLRAECRDELWWASALT